MIHNKTFTCPSLCIIQCMSLCLSNKTSYQLLNQLSPYFPNVGSGCRQPPPSLGRGRRRSNRSRMGNSRLVVRHFPRPWWSGTELATWWIGNRVHYGKWVVFVYGYMKPISWNGKLTTGGSALSAFTVVLGRARNMVDRVPCILR